MSLSPRDTTGPGAPTPALEARLQRAAAAFRYPETPDLAARERRRLADAARPTAARGRSPRALGWALAALALLILVAGLVSPVRARVLDWIRIGSVRIFFNLPTPTATPLPSATPVGTPTGAPSGTPTPAVTHTPSVTPTFLQSVLDLAGETSLDNARKQAGFPIQLPAEPPDLGAPDHVYVQDMGGLAVILVWMDRDHPGQVRMSLSESSSSQSIFEKYQPNAVQDTQVGGRQAVWIDGNYLLVMRNGDSNLTRLVNQSHTLIWSTDQMTYRLETDVDLPEALRIAQSLRQ